MERQRSRRDISNWRMSAETLGKGRTKINMGKNKIADYVKNGKEKQMKNKVEKE